MKTGYIHVSCLAVFAVVLFGCSSGARTHPNFDVSELLGLSTYEVFQRIPETRNCEFNCRHVWTAKSERDSHRFLIDFKFGSETPYLNALELGTFVEAGLVLPIHTQDLRVSEVLRGKIESASATFYWSHGTASDFVGTGGSFSSTSSPEQWKGTGSYIEFVNRPLKELIGVQPVLLTPDVDTDSNPVILVLNDINVRSDLGIAILQTSKFKLTIADGMEQEESDLLVLYVPWNSGNRLNEIYTRYPGRGEPHWKEFDGSSDVWATLLSNPVTGIYVRRRVECRLTDRGASMRE